MDMIGNSLPGQSRFGMTPMNLVVLFLRGFLRNPRLEEVWDAPSGDFFRVDSHLKCDKGERVVYFDTELLMLVQAHISCTHLTLLPAVTHVQS